MITYKVISYIDKFNMLKNCKPEISAYEFLNKWNLNKIYTYMYGYSRYSSYFVFGSFISSILSTFSNKNNLFGSEYINQIGYFDRFYGNNLVVLTLMTKSNHQKFSNKLYLQNDHFFMIKESVEIISSYNNNYFKSLKQCEFNIYHIENNDICVEIQNMKKNKLSFQFNTYIIHYFLRQDDELYKISKYLFNHSILINNKKKILNYNNIFQFLPNYKKLFNY